MSNVIRRDFLKQSLGALGGLYAGSRSAHILGAENDEGQEESQSRFRYLGWMVGLSYQTPRPEGKRPEELRQLIREMCDHGMNFLSIMLISYFRFDEEHDGFCWPTRRPSLRCYREPNSLNANEETEFLGQIIQEAKTAGLHVQLMTNWGIWNPERISQGYPRAQLQLNAEGNSGTRWDHCPDSPEAYRCGRDVILDALERYADFGVDSYMIEYPGYNLGCHCLYTQKAFFRDTGKTLTPEWPGNNAGRWHHWKRENIGRILKRLVDDIHTETPGIEIWQHTACTKHRGHSPELLQKAGIKYTSPYMLHTADDFSDVQHNLQAVHPLPAVGHVCVRSKPFKNYSIPPKTPEMIGKFFDYIEQGEWDNLAGLMFFNESNVSQENRRAVYKGIQRFL